VGTVGVHVSIPVTVRSKTCLYGRSLAGIAGSNPAGGLIVSLSLSLSCECFVLSGRGLCCRATRPEESYQVWCVSDFETPKTRKTRPTRAVEP
jgi:hypothetical protein